MMVKTALLLSAFGLSSLAAAAATSSPSATRTSGNAAGPSPTVSIFFPEYEELDPRVPGFNVSIVAVNKPLTTVALCIVEAEGQSACADGLSHVVTIDDASKTIEYNQQTSTQNFSVSNKVGCTVTVSASAATCLATVSVSGLGSATSSVVTTTYTGSAVRFYPATVTAGAEKLTQGSSSATSSPSGSRTTGGPSSSNGSSGPNTTSSTKNAVPKITGMPNLALVGGAAVVGAVMAL